MPNYFLCMAIACAGSAFSQVASANFKIEINGQSSGQELTPATAVPGEKLSLETFGAQVIAAFGTGVDIEQQAEGRWTVTAPNKIGIYPLHLSGADGTTKSIQLIVGKPFTGQTSESGYALGSYPNPDTAPHETLYANPKSLVELRRDNLKERVSSHFRLGQFMCKQDSDWPRYVVIDRPLVVMLENIVTLLNSKGIKANTLSMLSGYRTPAYNAGLGNAVYSRHIYGDAADVYVDSDNDGFMDDLNGDGLVSLEDAQLFAELINTLPDSERSGIGVYAATSSHGPFVHVDTRGTKARWGHWH